MSGAAEALASVGFVEVGSELTAVVLAGVGVVTDGCGSVAGALGLAEESFWS